MFEKVSALTVRELRTWTKSRGLAATFFVGPLIWIFIFGNAFNSAFFNSSSEISNLQGAPNYFNFIAASMFVILPMSYANRMGPSLFADRFKGYLDRLLVSPTSRETLLYAKIAAGILLGMVQTVVLMVLTLPLGLSTQNLTPTSILMLAATEVMVSYGYCSVFLMVSMRIKRWTTQGLVAGLIVTPIMFLSNAFYPESHLPTLIRGLVSLNPVSYGIAITRQLLFQGPALTASLIYDLGILVLFVALATTALFVTSRKWL